MRSQIESEMTARKFCFLRDLVKHTASCANDSLQRGKESHVASESMSMNGAVPSNKDGKDAVVQDEVRQAQQPQVQA